MEIQHKLLSNAIETAQKKVEGRNFTIRKHVLEYDDVMNKQREIIYGQRRQVLEGQDLHAYYQKMISQVMREIMLDFCADMPNSAEWDIAALQARILDVFGELKTLKKFSQARKGLEAEELTNELTQEALDRYEKRAEEIGSAELLREAERMILLRTVDSKWMDHIDMMDDLRDSIGMRGYAQHDPVVEYRKEGFVMFDAMTAAIREDSVRLMMRARFTAETATRRQAVARNTTEAHSSNSSFGGGNSSAAQQPSAAPKVAKPPVAAPVKRDMAKVGRNDPCPCGSGKKYKNCHGQNENG
jgi:preprotein translocase subunit SecA